MRRLLQFRNELVIVWRAFFAPETPLWLKGLMLVIPAYLLSPIDLIPDFIPFAGWIDDLVLVPLMVSWIVKMLPPQAVAATSRPRRAETTTSYRRM
jgi:uncharacterized membrane protein YkvA (DUF1232 family)